MVDMSNGKDVECGALEQGRETGLTNNSGKIPKAKDKNNPPNPATTNPLKQSKTPELVCWVTSQRCGDDFRYFVLPQGEKRGL